MNTPVSPTERAEPPRAGPLREAPGPAGPAQAPRNVVASAAPEERRILAVVGEVRRVGRWVVPRLCRVRALLSEVKVDLRDGPIPEGCTVDVAALGARVTVVVPPDVTVAFDVFAVLGNAVSQAHEPAAGATAPTVRVTGSAFLGEVRVLVRERAT